MKDKQITPENIRSHGFLSRHSAIINAGHNAYLLGKPNGEKIDGIADNPWPMGSERAVAWYIGWRDARDHYELNAFKNLPEVLFSPLEEAVKKAA